MMGAEPEGRRRVFIQLLLNRQRRLAFSQPRPVADTKDVCIHCEGFRTEGSVHYNIGGLSPDAGKRFQHIPVGGHLTVMITRKNLGERDDVLRLCIEQADGLDVFL